VDFVRDPRPVPISLVGGRGHYEAVVEAVTKAETSVWIATANLKELMIEHGRRRWRSVLASFDELSARGVELRILHAGIPSRPFREELGRRKKLARRLAMRTCPRVHLKAVIVDGRFLYLGSANWTGAGLGAKGAGRRNFELGIITDDADLLDDVQGLYERIWRGDECAACKLRTECGAPLDEIR
jgi:phosphatidylserine/phosphatidylglycerophosphate/cardiolipin synthase-like enzyme